MDAITSSPRMTLVSFRFVGSDAGRPRKRYAIFAELVVKIFQNLESFSFNYTKIQPS